MTDEERNTGTGLEHLLPVSPGHTISPELLGLTPGDLLAQSNKLLRHLDILDSCKGVVPLPLHLYGHRIYILGIVSKFFLNRLSFNY